MRPCEIDDLVVSSCHPTVFHTSSSVRCIILAVYIDDILITWSDIIDITWDMGYLHRYLTIRDLSTLKYFLSIEFAYRPLKLVLNQRKYVFDILTEVGLLGCKPRASPINSKPNFLDSTSPLIVNVHAYCWLMGKLIHLTVTRPDITYMVGLLSHFMRWQVALRVLAYLEHAPRRGLLFLQHGHFRVEAYSNSK